VLLGEADLARQMAQAALQPAEACDA